MRDYAKASSRFWTGETGKQLRGQADPQRVAFYLFTAPSSNMIGLYYLPLPTLMHEVGISIEGASEALRRVSEVGFAYYDTKSEYVWVPEMAAQQIAETLTVPDKRIRGVINELEKHVKCPYYKDFVARYNTPFHLKIQPARGSPSEGASKGLRCQEQEQEQDIGKGKEKDGEAALPPTLPLQLGESGYCVLTAEQHGKLQERLKDKLQFYVDRFDRFVSEAPDQKTKSGGVRRKDRKAYQTILNWFDTDQKEGGNGTGNLRPNATGPAGGGGPSRLNRPYTARS